MSSTDRPEDEPGTPLRTKPVCRGGYPRQQHPSTQKIPAAPPYAAYTSTPEHWCPRRREFSDRSPSSRCREETRLLSYREDRNPAALSLSLLKCSLDYGYDRPTQAATSIKPMRPHPRSLSPLPLHFANRFSTRLHRLFESSDRDSCARAPSQSVGAPARMARLPRVTTRL